MRTKLIQSGVPDKFFDDVVALTTIPSNAFEALLESIGDRFGPDRAIDAKTLVPAASKYNVTVDTFVRALSISVSLLMNEREIGDSISDILQDISDLGKVDPAALPDLNEKLLFVKERVFSKIAAINDEFNALGSAFPRLSHLGTRCCVTTKMTPGFDNAIDSPGSYVPSVALTVPVVVVQLDIDSFGDEQSLSFGLTGTGLTEFINHLRLAQTELLAVKKRFGLV